MASITMVKITLAAPTPNNDQQLEQPKERVARQAYWNYDDYYNDLDGYYGNYDEQVDPPHVIYHHYDPVTMTHHYIHAHPDHKRLFVLNTFG